MSNFNFNLNNLSKSQRYKNGIFDDKKNEKNLNIEKPSQNKKLFDFGNDKDLNNDNLDLFEKYNMKDNEIYDFSMLELKDDSLDNLKKPDNFKEAPVISGKVGSVEFLSEKLLHIPNNAISDIFYNDKGQVVDFKYTSMFGEGQHYKVTYLDENKIQVDVSAVVNNNGQNFEYNVSNKVYYLNEIEDSFR